MLMAAAAPHGAHPWPGEGHQHARARARGELQRPRALCHTAHQAVAAGTPHMAAQVRAPGA
eukprot:1414038-Pyramimonas_sp.AAC.1